MIRQEKQVFNQGERLIPFKSLDLDEVVRHRSSYEFYCAVIDSDSILAQACNRPIQIADFGCGVGHGCFELARIKNSQVTGLDNSQIALDYASHHYSRKNICYESADLAEYLKSMPEFDYIVSRHALEHIDDGLELIEKARYSQRMIIEVPYDEPRGNPHHLVHSIREESFDRLCQSGCSCEFFYQNMNGVIYKASNVPVKPNGILCALTRSELPSIESMHSFPMSAWRPSWFRRVQARFFPWPTGFERTQTR